MRWLAFALLAACHPSPVPTPPVVPIAPFCAGAVSLGLAGECRGMFTSEGRPCSVCGGASACVDRQSGVYCVYGACLDDGTCRSEPGTLLGRR